MTESEVTRKLLKELKQVGWFYKASDRFRAGIPDIIGCCRGSFVAIEMKVDNNDTTDLQDKELFCIGLEYGQSYTCRYNRKLKVFSIGDQEFKNANMVAQWILKLSLSSTKDVVLN